MAINQALIMEFKHETVNSRKMLERIPADKYTWKPHEKSMELMKLAIHIARIPAWIGMIVNANELDMSKNPMPPLPVLNSGNELLAFFDKNVADAIKAMEAVTDEHLMKPWSLKQGEKVFFTMPGLAAIRSMAFNHTIHHRGQLSVYLRLLNVAVPGMYGPSADEKM